MAAAATLARASLRSRAGIEGARPRPASPAPLNRNWHALSTSPESLRVSAPAEAHERDADRLAGEFMRSRASAESDRRRLPEAFGRFVGHDLTGVRVHEDAEVDARADALGTKAFTLGEDIGVRRGHASVPILAHELAHVVGQRSQPGGAATLWRQTPADDEERRKQRETAGKPPPKPAADKPKADVPFVHDYALFGLGGDAFNRSLTTRYPELKLTGDEFYGAWALGWALMNPLFQPPPVQGGDAKPGEWSQDYTRFTKYVSALQKLTPGKGDPYLDTISLITGTRIEDYLGHDRFLKQALPKYGLQAAAHLALIQGIYSIAMTMKEPGISGQLETSPWFNHLGLLTTLGGAATKKFTTLGNNPLDVGIPIGNEAGLPMTGPLSPGRPAAGLTLDFKQGVDQPGSQANFGLPLNLGRMFASDEPGKPKSPFELGLWGSYNQLEPTETMKAAGGVPSTNWSVGAHGGYNWGAGGQYSFLQSGGLRLHQGDLGVGYQPREPKSALAAGPVSFPRFGVNASYANWTGADASSYAPRLGSDRGQAFRFSPFLDLGFNLGKGYKLDVGGQTTTTFRGGTDPQRYLDGLRLMLALQHQPAGTPDSDRKRLELSYSQNHRDWLDPKSPMMQALRLEGQWGPWFLGAQFNWMKPGLAALQGGPYAGDFANSPDPLRDWSLLGIFGYRFGAQQYPWGFHPGD